MEQKPVNQPAEQAEDILSKARANRKSIVGLSVFCVVVLAIAFIWIVVAQSGSRKADDMIALADMEQNDSIATTLYAQAAEAGYKSGNRAKAEMGIRLFREKKYEEAIKYLSDASLDDDVAAAGVYALQGDCYVNLDQNENALKCFDKAISTADNNPQIVPFLLVKKANIYRAEGKYAEEAAAYKTILDKYAEYAMSSQSDLRKYYERAAAQAKK